MFYLAMIFRVAPFFVGGGVMALTILLIRLKNYRKIFFRETVRLQTASFDVCTVRICSLKLKV